MTRPPRVAQTQTLGRSSGKMHPSGRHDLHTSSRVSRMFLWCKVFFQISVEVLEKWATQVVRTSDPCHECRPASGWKNLQLLCLRMRKLISSFASFFFDYFIVLYAVKLSSLIWGSSSDCFRNNSFLGIKCKPNDIPPHTLQWCRRSEGTERIGVLGQVL